MDKTTYDHTKTDIHTQTGADKANTEREKAVLPAERCFPLML